MDGQGWEGVMNANELWVKFFFGWFISTIQ